MKTWQPDTCECVIEEIYNGTEIIGGGEVVSKCKVHQDVADKDLYGVLYSNPDGENKVKNHVYRILLGYEGVKDLGLEELKTTTDGESAGLGLKTGLKYEWSFSGEGATRIFAFEVKGAILTQDQKDAILAEASVKFGDGKVEVK